jgi:hypothetical protein
MSQAHLISAGFPQQNLTGKWESVEKKGQAEACPRPQKEGQ